MRLEYGQITAELHRERQEILIANASYELSLSNTEALSLLNWLQEQEPILRSMVEGQNVASQSGAAAPGRPSQAEGDLETVEESLGERQSGAPQRPAAAPGRPSQAEGDLETVEENLRQREKSG